MHDQIKFFALPPVFAALLLGAAPTQARPLLTPLLKPPTFAAILTVPPKPVPLPAFTPTVAPALLMFPSLRLTDWQHVFDIAALGAFDVPLRDDPGERTNILLSASAVDALTVAPGAEFSFNDAVGERTTERGFQDGLMFDQGRVVRGTGGGICLVATGLYNAALQAGLTITERHPHSGLVSYAAPGCDAGIAYGSEDLKFRNTTGHPLVIGAQAYGDHVAVRLFGHVPPPGQAVIIKPLSFSPIPYAVVTKPDPTLLPGQTVIDQKPRAGYTVVVGRFWTRHGRVVRREIVADERRAPRNEIIRVAVPQAQPLGPTPMLGPFSEPTPMQPTLAEPTPAQAPTLPSLLAGPRQRVQREGAANLFAGVGSQ